MNWKTPAILASCVLGSLLLAGSGGQTPVYSGSNGTFSILTGGTILDSGVISAAALATNGSGQLIAATLTGTGAIARASTLPVAGTGTYTVATSDAFSVTGATSSSHCVFSPTNATAAAATVLGYISAVGTDSVTITHAATTPSGGTVNIVCTTN